MMKPRLLQLESHGDSRGDLIVAQELPFAAKRVFFSYALRSGITQRGAHAHRRCQQILLAVSGTIYVTAGDHSFDLLEGVGFGLYVPPLTWIELEMLPRSILAVFCSDEYDQADYIRSKEELEKVWQQQLSFAI